MIQCIHFPERFDQVLTLFFTFKVAGGATSLRGLSLTLILRKCTCTLQLKNNKYTRLYKPFVIDTLDTGYVLTRVRFDQFRVVKTYPGYVLTRVPLEQGTF